MLDAPGPWATGPFTLAEGYSAIRNDIAIVSIDPFACTWRPTEELRTDRVVLEANTDHWNAERGPRLETVVFRNDIDPQRALELVCTTEGEVDIVTDVAPSDAQRVEDSEHAKLITIDAMRVVVGIVNRRADDVPLDDSTSAVPQPRRRPLQARRRGLRRLRDGDTGADAAMGCRLPRRPRSLCPRHRACS